MEAAPGLSAVRLPATSVISLLHQRSKDTIRDVTTAEPPHAHLQLFYLEDDTSALLYRGCHAPSTLRSHSHTDTSGPFLPDGLFHLLYLLPRWFYPQERSRCLRLHFCSIVTLTVTGQSSGADTLPETLNQL